MGKLKKPLKQQSGLYARRKAIIQRPAHKTEVAPQIMAGLA